MNKRQLTIAPGFEFSRLCCLRLVRDLSVCARDSHEIVISQGRRRLFRSLGKAARGGGGEAGAILSSVQIIILSARLPRIASSPQFDAALFAGKVVAGTEGNSIT